MSDLAQKLSEIRDPDHALKLCQELRREAQKSVQLAVVLRFASDLAELIYLAKNDPRSYNAAVRYRNCEAKYRLATEPEYRAIMIAFNKKIIEINGFLRAAPWLIKP